MAVKRVTIELDDSSDINRSTAIPSTVVYGENLLPNGDRQTATPDTQDDYGQVENHSESIQTGNTETIGRTPADLVVTYINRPEFVVTGLTFLSFFICVGKLAEPRNFWIPVSVSAILNSIWFGIAFIRKQISK